MDLAQANIEKLRAEVEYERRLRRKAESLSRALAWELSEERAGREATERVCKELAEAVMREREETERVMGEVEEERRMMRIAEVLREERVQMKLSEARIFMEEKLREVSEGGEGRDVMGLYGDFALGTEGDIGQRRRVMGNHHVKRGIEGLVEFPRKGRVQAGIVGGSSSFSVSSWFSGSKGEKKDASTER